MRDPAMAKIRAAIVGPTPQLRGASPYYYDRPRNGTMVPFGDYMWLPAPGLSGLGEGVTVGYGNFELFVSALVGLMGGLMLGSVAERKFFR